MPAAESREADSVGAAGQRPVAGGTETETAAASRGAG